MQNHSDHAYTAAEINGQALTDRFGEWGMRTRKQSCFRSNRGFNLGRWRKGEIQMGAVLQFTLLPIILLNFFGAIGSGIWLGIEGQWWAIGIGLAGLFSHFLLGIALLPGIALGLPGAALVEKGRLLPAFPFILLTNLYTCALVSAWCATVFWVFMSRASEDTAWPLIIWSYGVATGPWTYMASKDPESVGSGIAAMSAQIGYVVAGLLAMLTKISLIDTLTVFLLIQAIGLIAQLWIGIAVVREQRRLEKFSSR